jgi:hypothetical protein
MIRAADVVKSVNGYAYSMFDPMMLEQMAAWIPNDVRGAAI